MTTPNSDERQATISDAKLQDLRTQAELGDASAQLALGRFFAARREGAGNQAEARAWYHEVLNNSIAPRELCAEALVGLASISDDEPSDALRYYRRAAELGNADAQFHLGLIHAREGKPADDEIAVLWLSKVAQQDMRAALALGRMYELGRGVIEDGAQAATWYEHALDRVSRSTALPDILPVMIEYGFANPCFLKGLMHDYGWTIARDDAKAAYYYRQAFEQHSGRKADARASAQLDAHCATGDVNWLRRAAASGHSDAQYLLGRHHLGSKDAIAVFWFLKAAEQHHFSALIDLAIMLSKPATPTAADQIQKAVAHFERGMLTDREAHQKIRDLLCGSIPGSTC